MFIQVVQGRTDDAPALRAAVDRWLEEISPGATGWLGSTGGVTPDGQFVAVVRFESAEAARRNSNRPEQDRWWSDTSKLLDSVVFHDCTDVLTLRGGGSDDAGFVQVIQGRVRDLDRLKELLLASEDDIGEKRPDVIGSTAAFSDDGTATETVYFTSEAEARQQERAEPSEEAEARLAEMTRVLDGLTFLDLRDPWLSSPR